MEQTKDDFENTTASPQSYQHYDAPETAPPPDSSGLIPDDRLSSPPPMTSHKYYAYQPVPHGYAPQPQSEYPQHGGYGAPGYANAIPNPNPNSNGKQKRICGMTSTVFWLVLIIVILIIGGAIGGGVGGSLASKNSNSNAS